MIHIYKKFVYLTFVLLLAFTMVPILVSTAGAYYDGDTEWMGNYVSTYYDDSTAAWRAARPVAIAIDSGTQNKFVIFWADSPWKHYVVKFDGNNKELFRWGTYGIKPGEFYWPKDIVSYNNRVYILDKFSPSRIQVFDATDGGYITTFVGGEYLSYASNLAIDPATGYIWVTDTGNNRIVALSQEGSIVKQFPYSSAGWLRGIVLGPDNNFYVAEQTYDPERDETYGRIMVFTKNGDVVRTFGSGYDLFAPSYLTVTPSGYLAVSTRNPNGFIQMFTLDGKLVGKWGQEGIREENYVYPLGLANDNKGNILTAEFGHKKMMTHYPMYDGDDDGIADDVDIEPATPSLNFKKGINSGKIPAEYQGKITVKSNPNANEPADRDNGIVIRARVDAVSFTSDKTGAEILLGKTNDWLGYTDDVPDTAGVVWSRARARKLVLGSKITLKNLLRPTSNYELAAILNKDGQAVGYWKEMGTDLVEKHHLKGWLGNTESVRAEIWNELGVPKELMAYVDLAVGQEIGVKEDEGRPVLFNHGLDDIVVYIGGTHHTLVPGASYTVGGISNPKDVEELKAVPLNLAVTLMWKNPPDQIVGATGHKIYKKVFGQEIWELVYTTTDIDEIMCKVPELMNGTQYTFKVTVIDNTGGESLGVVTKDLDGITDRYVTPWLATPIPHQWSGVFDNFNSSNYGNPEDHGWTVVHGMGKMERMSRGIQRGYMQLTPDDPDKPLNFQVAKFVDKPQNFTDPKFIVKVQSKGVGCAIDVYFLASDGKNYVIRLMPDSNSTTDYLSPEPIKGRIITYYCGMLGYDGGWIDKVVDLNAILLQVLPGVTFIQYKGIVISGGMNIRNIRSGDVSSRELLWWGTILVEDVPSSGYPVIEKKKGIAMEFIEKCEVGPDMPTGIEGGLWKTNNILDSQYGIEAFNYLQVAANALMFVKNYNKPSLPAYTIDLCAEVLKIKLGKAGKLLAQGVIDEAKVAGIPDTDVHIAKAYEHLEKAKEYEAVEKYDLAIISYKQAWNSAEQALQLLKGL